MFLITTNLCPVRDIIQHSVHLVAFFATNGAWSEALPATSLTEREPLQSTIKLSYYQAADACTYYVLVFCKLVSTVVGLYLARASEHPAPTLLQEYGTVQVYLLMMMMIFIVNLSHATCNLLPAVVP